MGTGYWKTPTTVLCGRTGKLKIVKDLDANATILQNGKLDLGNLSWRTVGGAQHANNVPTWLTANRVNFITNLTDYIIQPNNGSGNEAGRQNGYNVSTGSGSCHPYNQYIGDVRRVLWNQR